MEYNSAQTLGITGLSYSGLRSGPIDPKKKSYQVGTQAEARTVHNKQFFDQTIFQKKDRTGFGGGFKIPDEYRVKKESMKKRKVDSKGDEFEEKVKDQGLITRDEIFAHLNLGSAESGVAAGKAGTQQSKAIITRDLIEGLEKDIEKLKRLEENIQRRKIQNQPGGAAFLEETDEDRERMRIDGLKHSVEQEGAHIIWVDEKRLQLFRHKPGQLDSLKDLDLNEIDNLRLAQQRKIDELEQKYYSMQKDAKCQPYIKKKLRELGKRRRHSSDDDQENEALNTDKKKTSFVQTEGSMKLAKSVRVHSESKVQVSPRRQTFEAKFDKFIVNKQQKDLATQRQKALKKDDFDTVSRSPKRLRSQKAVKKQPDSELIPDNYEQALLQHKPITDPFHGVSSEQKMTFYLLKWVFNAIKQVAPIEDKLLIGESYVNKQELVQQLARNAELLNALGCREQDLQSKVQNALCKKQGCLLWQEFLDLFFQKDGEAGWWNQIGLDGKKKHEQTPVKEGVVVEQTSSQKKQKEDTIAEHSKLVEITPALEILLNARRAKTEQEVENEFNKQQKLLLQQGPTKVSKQEAVDETVLVQLFGDSREKSKCLLLPSYIETMREVFERCDKYKDHILKRSAFLMALRTDEHIVDFIGADAVQVAHSKKVLTMDMVLSEVERDEYDGPVGQASMNHKDFITWKEFISYFEDYRESDERNSKEVKKQKKEKVVEVDPEEELKMLLQKEKEKRLQALPRVRPADMIDISEEHLLVIREVFDREKVGLVVNSVTFFLAIRKNPVLKRMSSALARDPEGTSRLPRETFQQVFERMEKDLQNKQFEWGVVIEYFTKRGRPLSKEEMMKLAEEDRRVKEDEMEQKRREEDQEKRKMQRLMEEMEQDEDFEAYQARLKSQQEEESDENKEVEQRPRRYQSVGTDALVFEKQSKKSKVTVPKPFGFEIRDKSKTKGIREQKVEQMLEERRQQEKDELEFRSKPKPIPPQVLKPRFEQINQQNEMRRQKVKEQSLLITKENERPFSFWEREKQKGLDRSNTEPALNIECQRQAFRANPIPKACSVLIYDKKIEEEEIARQKRIHSMAELSYSRSSMPSRMQKDLDRKKQLPPKDLAEQYSFKPKIGELVTAEMFKTMQRKFEEKLLRKKSQMAKTKPRSPNFMKSKSRPLSRDFVNESQPTFKTHRHSESNKLFSKMVKQPSSTRATELAQKQRRDEMEAWKLKLEQQKQEDNERKLRQDRLKTQVQSLLGEKTQSAKEQISKSILEAKAKSMADEKETRRLIQQAVDRGRNTPMLLNSSSNIAIKKNEAILTAKKQFIQVLVDSGMQYRKAVDMAKLTADEKAMLEEEKFVDAMKKQHRRL